MKPNRIKDFYALQERQRALFKKKYCLHPTAPAGCSTNFGAAHTVQRAMIEKHLAEKQHVLMFKPDVNPKLNAVLFMPKPIGINNATTFYGFCGNHDNKLFLPLETKDFSFEASQIARLGFRAFSRELYCKDAQLHGNTMLKDHMLKTPELQTLDRLQYLAGSHLSLSNARRNLTDGWRHFGTFMEGDSFDDLRYFAVRFDHAPSYFTSVAFLPEWDFSGNAVQDLSSLDRFKGIAFSAWAAKDKAVAVFCWHRNWDSVCIPFIRSVQSIDMDRLANRLLSMAFEVSENIVFRPSWWEGLSEKDKELLTVRVPSGLNSQDRTRESLFDDGLNALSGNVLDIISNI